MSIASSVEANTPQSRTLQSRIRLAPSRNHCASLTPSRKHNCIIIESSINHHQSSRRVMVFVFDGDDDDE
jgi:hypothetical protein